MRFIHAALLLLFPLTLHAQDTLWTPQHVAKLRVVTEAVISPDGTQVAYVLSVPRDLAKEKDGPSWAELHVVDTKGKSKAFVTGEVNVSHPVWMADGKQIAFLQKFPTKPGTTAAIFRIYTDGGAPISVAHFPTDIQSFSFSGDGMKLAFLAAEPVDAKKKKLLDQGFNQEIYEEDAPFTRVWI